MSGKISFSFSKVKPKTNFQTKRQEPQEKVEFITSFDKNEKKVTNERPPELIIQAKPNATLEEKMSIKRKQETESANKINVENRNETGSNEDVSLEKLAIQELMDDSKKLNNKDKLISIPIGKTSKKLEDDVDYNSVPISQFGYAMLRGMGWAPGKGIGKKQKIVEVKEPTLRAGRMCLGAGAPPVKQEERDTPPVEKIAEG